MRGLGEEEREREEPRGGASEERLEREEEAGGDAEERVAAAAQGHREVERRSGGRDRGLEGEDGEPPLADGVAGRALDLGKRGRARARKERERWVCFGLGFGGGRQLELVLFRRGRTLAVRFRSGAQIIHSLNTPTGFSGPKAKLRPKFGLGA